MNASAHTLGTPAASDVFESEDGLLVRRVSRLSVEVLVPGTRVGAVYNLPIPELRQGVHSAEAWRAFADQCRTSISIRRMRALAEFASACA